MLSTATQNISSSIENVFPDYVSVSYDYAKTYTLEKTFLAVANFEGLGDIYFQTE